MAPQQAKAAREPVLVKMAGLRRRQTLPVERVNASQVEAIGRVIRAKLPDRPSGFAKDYLRAVVDEVRVSGKSATITGSYARRLSAVGGRKEDTDQVPSLMRDWRASHYTKLVTSPSFFFA